MNPIRSRVAGRIEPSDTDILRIGSTEDLDEAGVEVCLALIHEFVEVLRGILNASQALCVFVGKLEHLNRVEQSLGRPFEDLVKVGLAVLDRTGIEAERDDVRGDAQRIEPGVRGIEDRLNLVVGIGELGEFRDRRAIDLLNRTHLVLGVLVVKQRVREHPVEVGALTGAARPFRNAPRPLRILIEISDLLCRVGGVLLTERQRRDGRSRAGLGRRRRHELPFILERHRHRLTRDVDGLGRHDPIEELGGEQVVEFLGRRQIVAPSVTVSLWITNERTILAGRIDNRGNLIVVRVRDLSVRAGEVPGKTVEHRGNDIVGHRVEVEIADDVLSAQERQLLGQQIGHLTLERENGLRVICRRNRIRLVHEEPERRVHCVGEGLVTEQHIQIGNLRSGQQHRQIRPDRQLRNLPGREELLCPCEHRLIRLDDTEGVNVLGVAV